MKSLLLSSFLLLTLSISCKKGSSSESEGNPRDSGVNLFKTVGKEGSAPTPTIGKLLIGTDTELTPDPSLADKVSADVDNLCKSCSELKTEISSFQKVAQNWTLSPTLRSLLGSSKLCTDLNSLQDLQDATEKQIDAFASTPSTTENEGGSSGVVELTNATNDFRDKVRSYIAKFKPLHSRTALVDSLQKRCP